MQCVESVSMRPQLRSPNDVFSPTSMLGSVRIHLGVYIRYRRSRYQAAEQGNAGWAAKQYMQLQTVVCFEPYSGSNSDIPCLDPEKALIRVVFMQDLQPYWSTYMNLH
ncbi:hypothetical protein ACQKWADRAFT_283839 [Trichoderma austrokoningii]